MRDRFTLDLRHVCDRCDAEGVFKASVSISADTELLVCDKIEPPDDWEERFNRGGGPYSPYTQYLCSKHKDEE